MRGWLRRGRLAVALGAALVAAAAVGPASARADGPVLYRGNGTEPETLDVHRSTGIPEFDLEVDLFEGLVHYGPAGEPVPGVAERWSLSDDGLTYTFSLRTNAKWSNGDPVTA